MYAIYIELGYDIPHKFDYVVRHIFLTSFVMNITLSKYGTRISRKGWKKWMLIICPIEKKKL